MSHSLKPTADIQAAVHADYLHLHANPELSMQEHQTAAYIESRLAALGIEHFRCGGTGVVGVLRNGPGPVIAFRADSDGLPIKEATGAEYASTAVGQLADGTEVPLMHGCGHDTHVASALGAAAVLAQGTEGWSGTVVLVFQPGEETGAGAAAMLADGLWDKAPVPEVVLGQHVFPFAAGTIHLTPESAMALARPDISPLAKRALRRKLMLTPRSLSSSSSAPPSSEAAPPFSITVGASPTRPIFSG